MQNSIKLSNNTTILKYQNWELSQNREKIADFIYERFTERYIFPLTTGRKNRFIMMGAASLLIETYESFRNGYENTRPAGFGEKCFKDFFNREANFSVLTGRGRDFYQNVRCGILHQGETKDGWKINRGESSQLFESATKSINANVFLKNMERVIANYRDELKITDWNDPLWKHFRDKMDFVILNC